MDSTPVSVFYSYAHEDEQLLADLRGHLKILERRGVLAPWHDRQIVAGQDWGREISDNLRRAELILLLISKDFIDSDYIMGVELQAAMQQHAAQLSTVVPIMVRAVSIEPEDEELLPFMKCQGLPVDLRPVTSWPNADEAWTSVAKGLRATVKEIQARRTAAVPAAPSGPAPRGIGLAVPEPAPAAAMPPAPRAGRPLPARPDAVRAAPPARPVTPAPAAAPPDDPVLERLLADVETQLGEAARLRGQGAPAGADLRRAAAPLIDTPDQKRVLWVDDRPEGNRHETAALAKLQIEVLNARSTAEAEALIANDEEGIDLVISDWERRGDGAQAGLDLLQRLRASHPGIPLIYYHGTFDAARRAQLQRLAQAGGAFGEAVLPLELLELVRRALAG